MKNVLQQKTICGRNCSYDDIPEKISLLMEKYLEFKPMYETLYQICQKTVQSEWIHLFSYI